MAFGYSRVSGCFVAYITHPRLEEQGASRVSYELVARPLATVVTVTVLCHPQLTLGLDEVINDEVINDEVINESEAQLGKPLS